MAFGVVLIAKANLGVSPLSSIPFAVSGITGLSFGGMTTAFHILCVLLQAILLKKITVKILLQLPLATVFGLIVNLFTGLLQFGAMSLWLRIPLNFAGTFCSALGIVLIVNMDLMLPPPDAFLRECSVQFHQPLSRVKIIGDITFVAVTVILELVFRGRITAVGIGTVISMYFTGVFVGFLKKRMTFLEMPPTNAYWEARKKVETVPAEEGRKGEGQEPPQ